MKARLLGFVLAALLLVDGCGSSKKRNKTALPLDAGPGLAVVLVWSAPVDLDLYLTDPLGETAYFGNPWTRSGTKLTSDATCTEISAGESAQREVAGTVRPAPGRYRISVDFVDRCGRDVAAVPFRIWAKLGGAVEEITASVHYRQRSAGVLELEVTADAAMLRRAPNSSEPMTIFPAARKVI